MEIMFKNANILTKDFKILESYDLIVEENIIKKIQKTSSNDNKYAEVIECNNNILMAGFKNAHTHNGMTFARSLTDDVPLDIWLNEKIFPMEAKLNEEDVYYFTMLGIMENLTSGITSCMEMYKYNYTLADVYYNVGMRVKLVDSITKFDKVVIPEELYTNLNDYEKYKGVKKSKKNNLISYFYGLHAEYTNDENTMNLISELSHKYKAPVFSHNSETKKEVEECKKRWGGLTPTEVHDKFGLYDFGGGAYHGVYLNDRDIEIFKEKNLTIIINAASNLKLASGIANVKKYIDEGINVAIGTDGPASNNAIDIFREMYLISNLAKYINGTPEALKSNVIIDMAIKNTAKCMDENSDCIEEGKLADIILIDKNTPNMQPENDFINNLVYAGNKKNVILTMVNGNILYRNNKFYIGEEEQYVYKKCNELLKKLKEKL